MTGDDDSVVLPDGPVAPTVARAWFAARAGELSDDLVDDALLVISELVTNAVRYGRPDVVLSVRSDPDEVRIAVSDGGDDVPRLPARHPDVDRPSGRGLLIVVATAHAWGVRPRVGAAAGKTIWATLRRS